MTLENRLNGLERRLDPDSARTTFHFCHEHDGMTWEEHRDWHRERGESLFTLDLGAADIRGADRDL